MILYFIRHGDPIYEPDSLTALGHLQANALAKRLSRYGIEKIYSSSSVRARQTAEPTCELLRKKMEILDKNGNGTGKYTFNAKGTLYKKFNSQTDKIPSFKDVETGELYSSIYARILIKHRRKIK